MSAAKVPAKGILRRILENGLLLLFGCLLALGVGEMGARVVWIDPPPPEKQPEPPPGLPQLESVQSLKRPSVRGIHRGVLYETNRFGFRDREVSQKPLPGVFRIVVVGDSFTMGQSVLVEDSYPKVLERLLNETGTASYEVLNLGLSALSITGVHRRLLTMGLRLKPDLVVYGLTLNDIKGPSYRNTMDKLAFARIHPAYTRFRHSRSRLMRLLWPRLHSMRELLFPPEGSYLSEVLLNYDEQTDAWKQFDEGLRRFGATQSQTETPVVVFIHTTPFYLNSFHPFLEIYEQIERAARAYGLPVIQSFPAFNGEDPRSVTVSTTDFHPNRRGHRLMAMRLRDGLMDLGLGE